MFFKKSYSRIGEVNTILLQNFDDEIFSAGTHFKDLRQNALNNDSKNFQKHIDSLQQLSFFTSCYDKPMIVNLKGTLANSAAVIFSNFHFALTSDENLKFKFNSIDYNCTPLGGELFLLKSLPNKIGLYLALTGGELTLSDLLKYKLIYDVADIDENTIEKLKRHTAWKPILKSYELNQIYTNDTRMKKKRDIEWTIEEFLERSERENPQKVLLDLYYRKNIIEHANIKQRMKQNKSYQIDNEHDRRVVEIENNHLGYEKFLKKHLNFFMYELEDSQVVQNRIKIFRIFQKEKIEDILQALEEDGSQFAIETYSKLQNKNKFFMQLIVDMFKVAEEKTFVECMEIEYATIKELFKNEQFRKSAFKQNQEFEFSSQLQVIEKDDDFQLKNHRKDLLPTKHYYKEFPEAFLCYLNQTDLQNPYQCNSYMEVVKSNLFRIGVDYLNPTYDREEVKTKLGMFFTQQKNLDQKFQEFHDFITDKKMLEEHLGQRKKALDDLIQKENFQEFLNQMIDNLMQQNFEQEQQLVEKRVKELKRIELSQNMNEIKNFFVTTFFTKPNTNALSDESIFDNHTLLDIGSDRFSLSKRYKKKINFDKLKKKYSTQHTVSPNELENYIKNKDVQINSNLDVKKGRNVVIDWSKQYVKKDSYLTRKRKWKVNIKFADYIYERGLPTAEIFFREQMVKNLKNTFERTCRVLNKNEQQQFEQVVLDTFFVDYNKYEDHRDLMNHALDNLLTFHKPIIGKQKIKLDNFQNEKSQDNTLFDLNEQKLEKLKNLIFLEKNEKLENNNFLLTCDSLKEYLLESEFLTQEEKQQFQTLFTQDNKFIQEFEVNCQKQFYEKMEEISNKDPNLQEDFLKQLNFIQVNYDLELRNYILSNIFYKNAKLFLKRVQDIYDKIKNECNFQDRQKILKIFQDEQIFLDKTKSDQENLNQLDQQIKLCISIINQTKNMITDKDLILDRQYDIIQEGLKSMVNESENVQKMVNFMKNEVEKLEDQDQHETQFIDFDQVSSITTTKHDLKKFMEKNRILRRKNWNVIFQEIVNLYTDMLSDSEKIYENNQNSILEIQRRYKENIEKVADKLLEEGVVVDYSPFSNLLMYHDKLLNKLKFQQFNDFQDLQISEQFFYLEKQNIDLSSSRFLNTTPPTILQMEKLSKRLAHKGSSAIDVYLKNNQSQQLQIIQETGEKWAMDQLQNILKDIFKIRRNLESKLTQNQLINLDLQISQILNKKCIGQLFEDSFNDYKFQLQDLQKKVQDFEHKDYSDKQESIDKVNRFSEIDITKNFDYLKLVYAFMMADHTNKDIMDFNLQEIENDFGLIIKNPKKFMRIRKKWTIKPAALMETEKDDVYMNQRKIAKDHSDIYSHASQIMFNKYNEARFKGDYQNSVDSLTRLNKKAEIVLTN